MNKANAVVVVTPYTCLATTYTGLPHTAPVVSITGVDGPDGRHGRHGGREQHDAHDAGHV